MMTDEYPIPARTNLIIALVCSILYFILLQLCADASSLGLKLLCGVTFGIVMIPVYSLMHEAAHHAMHPQQAWNQLLGRWLCLLFVTSFTFYRHCHLKHHKKNRTDDEMWDLYYDHQNKYLRYGNLYLMMMGFGYLALWLSVILFAFAPHLVNSSFFKKHKEIRGFLEGSERGDKLKISQLESLLVVLFQICCLWWIGWDIISWLILYLVHGFIWSSQNYVNHAFSPRDIINGAHNLIIPNWLNLIYLNFNLHLAHHQNPRIPWLHLPRFIRSGKGRFSFFRNYLRLWKGPRLTEEAAPNNLDH